MILYNCKNHFLSVSHLLGCLFLFDHVFAAVYFPRFIVCSSYFVGLHVFYLCHVVFKLAHFDFFPLCVGNKVHLLLTKSVTPCVTHWNVIVLYSYVFSHSLILVHMELITVIILEHQCFFSSQTRMSPGVTPPWMDATRRRAEEQLLIERYHKDSKLPFDLPS